MNAHKCDEAVGPACYLTIESNALSSPDTYAFEGNEPADIHSNLTVDAGPIVFGQTPIGTQSASQIIHVTLTNGSASVSAPFNLLAVSDSDFVINNQCPRVLVPVASATSGYATSCEILVTFVPQSQGFHIGALTFRSSLKGDSVPLAGTGVMPALKIAPASLQFPATAVGSSSASQTVTVTNQGSAAVTITRVTLMGGQADDYVLGTACGGSLAAGANCPITVTFKPVSAGSKLASVTVADSGGGSHLVSLSGSGTANAVPTVSLTAASLTFAKQAVGTSSSAQSLTLTNTGSAALSLISIAVSGAQADDYAVSKTCGASVASNASCTLSIVFRPVSAGTKHASITITDNASNTPQSVALTGTGSASVSPPAVKLSATTLAFGKQAVGTNSPAQSVTVSNGGGSSLTLTSITVTGPQADDYLLAKTCGASLAPSASCTVTVTFKPVSTGSKSGSITIADTASGSPQSITLTGTGT